MARRREQSRRDKAAARRSAGVCVTAAPARVQRRVAACMRSGKTPATRTAAGGPARQTAPVHVKLDDSMHRGLACHAKLAHSPGPVGGIPGSAYEALDRSRRVATTVADGELALVVVEAYTASGLVVRRYSGTQSAMTTWMSGWMNVDAPKWDWCVPPVPGTVPTGVNIETLDFHQPQNASGEHDDGSGSRYVLTAASINCTASVPYNAHGFVAPFSAADGSHFIAGEAPTQAVINDVDHRAASVIRYDASVYAGDLLQQKPILLRGSSENAQVTVRATGTSYNTGMGNFRTNSGTTPGSTTDYDAGRMPSFNPLWCVANGAPVMMFKSVGGEMSILLELHYEIANAIDVVAVLPAIPYGVSSGKNVHINSKYFPSEKLPKEMVVGSYQARPQVASYGGHEQEGPAQVGLLPAGHDIYRREQSAASSAVLGAGVIVKKHNLRHGEAAGVDLHEVKKAISKTTADKSSPDTFHSVLQDIEDAAKAAPEIAKGIGSAFQAIKSFF